MQRLSTEANGGSANGGPFGIAGGGSGNATGLGGGGGMSSAAGGGEGGNSYADNPNVVSDNRGNLHVTVKKTKPILGIAIEGGANTKHPLPRIINIHVSCWDVVDGAMMVEDDGVIGQMLWGF